MQIVPNRAKHHTLTQVEAKSKLPHFSGNKAFGFSCSRLLDFWIIHYVRTQNFPKN